MRQSGGAEYPNRNGNNYVHCNVHDRYMDEHEIPEMHPYEEMHPGEHMYEQPLDENERLDLRGGADCCKTVSGSLKDFVKRYNLARKLTKQVDAIRVHRDKCLCYFQLPLLSECKEEKKGCQCQY